MKRFYLLVLFALPIFGAEPLPPHIAIDATATVKIPADRITFSIHIQVNDPEPQQAFQRHKELEEHLITMIQDFGLPDSVVHYTLMEIREYHPRSSDPVKFRTSQHVRVTLTDFSQYEPFQLALVKQGFTNFEAGFSSVKLAEAKQQGYASAVTMAREDAASIAEAMGRSVGEVLQVDAQADDRRPFGQALTIQRTTLESLTDIQQSVTKRTKLSIIFALE